MTHGHELKGGLLEGMQDTRWRGKRGKYWDNCNSIINKIYFKQSIHQLDLHPTSQLRPWKSEGNKITVLA